MRGRKTCSPHGVWRPRLWPGLSQEVRPTSPFSPSRSRPNFLESTVLCEYSFRTETPPAQPTQVDGARATLCAMQQEPGPLVAMAKETVSAPAASPTRPGLKLGQTNEFTLIMPLKPGGADRMRERMQ